MPDPSPRQKSKITVEDLIQFKRCEAPSPEFWNKFDRDLKAKTLQTLLKPQPWYSRFHFTPVKIALGLLPLGGTAAAILMLLTISTGPAPMASQGTSAVVKTNQPGAEPSPANQAVPSETANIEESVSDDLYLASLQSSPQFVMDAITSESDANSYNKVMVSETYRASNRGTVYVADTFTAASAVSTMATAGLAHF